MLCYKASYRMQLGAFNARVLDFPDAEAFGPTLEMARDNLLQALRFAAEARLRRGDYLPLPDPTCGDADAYLLEPVSLWPTAGDRVQVVAG